MRYKIEFVKKKLAEIIKIGRFCQRRIGKKQCHGRKNTKTIEIDHLKIPAIGRSGGNDRVTEKKVCTHCWDGSSYFELA
jgi:hypothetical protein